MKKTILIILLAIPFWALGQNIAGTGWQETDADGDKMIILFEIDHTFTYLDLALQSENRGTVYNDETDTWALVGDSITISFTDGYMVLSGKINDTGNYMSGTYVNVKGLSGTWSAKLIEF